MKKVVFLSTNDQLGGAAIVTLRLVEALRAAGIDARMVVGNRYGSADYVSQTGELRRKTAKVLERGEIFMNNGFNLSDLWKVSTGRFGADVCGHPWIREADTVVLGWINQGFLSLSQLKKLCASGKNIVWWMHDLWCATGICHLPGKCRRFELGCGMCPLLHQAKSHADLSHRVWERKTGIFNQSNIRFVAVSSWQRDLALRGSLLKNHEIEVIPHAFPVEMSHISPRADFTSEKLEFINRLDGKKLIVMGAARLDDPVKDLPMAVRSLNMFMERHPHEAADCEVAFFGTLRNHDIMAQLRWPYHWLGPLDAEELRQLYSVASVVLSTSRFETMGATLMEGMAGGAIPVTFNHGGQGDIVIHGENGFIADYGSAESVAHNLALALPLTGSPFPREAQHASVTCRFSAESIASRFIRMLSRPAMAT
ncbi:MAG: glycosyltransferase [Muribaculaceae bacterium]|nr:glycosyltransferase [Muribaculaceae bacterium]